MNDAGTSLLINDEKTDTSKSRNLLAAGDPVGELADIRRNRKTDMVISNIGVTALASASQ
jgi:hypothetical protein